ncbi:helix-turn-helix domain-containing protein [Paenibacillus sp. LMG 31456]|uniref:Helix-turn-helix domain-containing protein n=1 Tax=Paenibacillus foliorum TaxID=2654974 RepID=A0A972K2W4_9BACL|nr:helix-turn-helix domain-containing protein [Paenibacillus foliorum]
MIYENIERLRKVRGITKTKLAKELDISLQGYRHIAYGNVRLDVERLQVIAKFFNVEPAIFFNTELTENVIKELLLKKEISKT